MLTLKATEALFVFEMANNHMGSLPHGLKVIREIHQVSKDYDFLFGFKLQYRHLETFIHPDFTFSGLKSHFATLKSYIPLQTVET